ncbi:MAG TPA: thioredoxin TrxC [Gammaproteobacteria bacterium]|nr:thioredoxin TrxC [Gammaproteobacteria bacterium]
MDQAGETLHIPCPACGGLNRVPAARLQQGPVCGRCGASLFPDQPVEVTDATFQRQVGRSDLPVVVDFWAGWCAPCQTMAPVVEAAARNLRPHARVAKLEVDANPQTAGRFGIRSIPTIVLFRDGQELDRVAGAMQANQFEPWVRQHL